MTLYVKCHKCGTEVQEYPSIYGERIDPKTYTCINCVESKK